MPQITEIRVQKNKERFNIYLDGKFAFAVTAEALVKAGLNVDKEIDQDKVEELIKEDDFKKVYDRTLKFFSYRPRSRKELRDWFRRKEIGEETQKLTVEKLESLGLLNDSEFSRWWIEQREIYHPGGRSLLKMELMKKGIAKEIIDESLSHVTPEDESKVAIEIAKKKMRSLVNSPRLEQKRRLYGILSRRGFRWETIKSVVDELIKKE